MDATTPPLAAGDRSLALCPNCGERTMAKYCSHCGEKRWDRDEWQLRHVAGEVFSEVTDVEHSKLWTTLVVHELRPVFRRYSARGAQPLQRSRRRWAWSRIERPLRR
jgi:hypothetical protein